MPSLSHFEGLDQVRGVTNHGVRGTTNRRQLQMGFFHRHGICPVCLHTWLELVRVRMYSFGFSLCMLERKKCWATHLILTFRTLFETCLGPRCATSVHWLMDSSTGPDDFFLSRTKTKSS